MGVWQWASFGNRASFPGHSMTHTVLVKQKASEKFNSFSFIYNKDWTMPNISFKDQQKILHIPWYPAYKNYQIQGVPE